MPKIHRDIIKEVSTEMGIPIEVVHRIYTHYWKYMKNVLQSVKLRKIKDENVDNTHISVHLTKIGRIGTTPHIIRKVNKQLGISKKKKYVQDK